MASPFLLSAVLKTAISRSDSRGAWSYRLEPAWLFAAAVIATQLGGSLLLLVGRYAWIGAGLLAGFTVVATLLAHAWWTKPPAEVARDFAIFWEHVAICGGLLLAAWLSWRERAS
jgi:uncharacterized membrane protein YphA (DoxX/SURF4 family)